MNPPKTRYEVELDRVDRVIEEAKRQTLLLDFMYGNLSYGQYKSLSLQDRRQYSRKWGRPRSVAEQEIAEKKRRKQIQRKKAARKSRRANLKKKGR